MELNTIIYCPRCSDTFSHSNKMFEQCPRCHNHIENPKWESEFYTHIKNETLSNDNPTIIIKNGTKEWHDSNGLLHRDNDLPAIIYSNGDQYWYQHGLLHRDNDLPAIILSNGYQYWFQYDKLHRDNNLPAFIHPNGTKEYWIDGKKIK